MSNNILKGLHNTTQELCGDGVITANFGGDTGVSSYSLKDFKHENVNFDFMVQSICKINRYDGHNKHKLGYNVGQHSIMMAQSALIAYGDVSLARQCLYHDLPEAYYGDIVKPLKNALGDGFKEFEQKIESVVFGVLDVEFPFDKRMKQLDINMAQLEMSILLSPDTSVYTNFTIWDSEKSVTEFYRMVSILDELEQYQQKELIY